MRSKNTPTFDIDTPDRDAIASQLGLQPASLIQGFPVQEATSQADSPIALVPPTTSSPDAIQLPVREEKEPLAQLNVRIRTTMQKRLRDYCYRHNVSQSEVIEFLLSQALPQQPETAQQGGA